MKTTLKTSLALLFGAAILTSCETCENASITPITDEDTSWLSYTKPVPSDGKPDTIRFSNETGAEVKFIRTHLSSSNVPADGYSFDDKCIEKMDTQASAVVQDVTRKMPAMATYILKKPNDLQLKLLVDKLGTYDLDEQNPTHASKEINGITYQNVFEITMNGNDTDDKGKLKKIYFNKAFGFIRVEFYGGKLLQLAH